MSTSRPESPHIFTDELTRRLYANDASMYEELPAGVVFPRNAEEIIRLVHAARERNLGITARAAGTSLAGQTTGGGLIADVSVHMNQVLSIDPEALTASVEPGVIRDALNRETAPYGLKFGPDTSTTNRCMLGGMIGNNSAGLYSVKYGSVRDHIRTLDVVLSDGSRAVFGPLTDAELAEKLEADTLEGRIYRGTLSLLKTHKEAILRDFPHPEIVRRNTGYALDKLCEMDPVNPNGRSFNMAELLCGSEGTLAFTVSATVNLVKHEPERVLFIPHFRDLQEAMEAVVHIVKMKPAAVELIDDHILKATEGNLEQQRNRFFLEEDPACLLIVEFEGDDTTVLKKQAEAAADKHREHKLGYAYPLFSDPEKMRRVWDLRKAGLGLLMGLGGDARTPTFVEDTAVRVQDLPAYVKAFRDIMDSYGTSCVFYAHASVGELHLRPALDIGKSEGVEKMKRMAEDIAALVKSFRGSLSGEHGDGRARSPYIEHVIGPGMVELLREIKQLWDPQGIFNPGKIVNAAPIDHQLRPYRNRNALSVQNTAFSWNKEGGFEEALQLCNGAGVCRKRADSGGTMCPSYMATLNEKDSTRGRANVLRQLFSRDGKAAFESREIKDALELCLSCKACKSECPANVDMAKMKSEFMLGWHRSKGMRVKDRFWANPFPMLRLASRFPQLSNLLVKKRIGRAVLGFPAGLHPDRPLPSFAPESFSSWIRSSPEVVSRSAGNTGPAVLLLVDPFTDLHHPEQAVAAVNVLEKMGCRLLRPVTASTGRTFISSGRPDKAAELLNELLPELAQQVGQGAVVVGLEPSELLTLRDEVHELCRPELLKEAEQVSNNTYLFEEFVALNQEIIRPDDIFVMKGEPVLVHAHCYVKALGSSDELLHCLRLAGYQPQETDSGCCGMAGSFGYRTETYELSMKIGRQRLFPAVEKWDKEALICAHGFSCRHQIQDGTGRKALHPAELLERAMRK